MSTLDYPCYIASDAGSVRVGSGITPGGVGEDRGVEMKIMNLPTPETETSSPDSSEDQAPSAAARKVLIGSQRDPANPKLAPSKPKAASLPVKYVVPLWCACRIPALTASRQDAASARNVDRRG